MTNNKDFRELSGDELRGMNSEEEPKIYTESDKNRSNMKYAVVTGTAALVLSTVLTNVIYLRAMEEEATQAVMPVPRDNEQLVVHPDFLNGWVARGYTMLTDIDRDGSWDLAERVHAGFTTGDHSRRLYFKEGFGPGQSVDAEVEFVKPEFFRPYE